VFREHAHLCSEKAFSQTDRLGPSFIIKGVFSELVNNGNIILESKEKKSKTSGNQVEIL
jgi:hypothetical protein